MSADREKELKAMTQQALVAAESGRWDQVVALYERRTQEFLLNEVSPELTRQLIEWDQAVQARADMVRAATRQNLLEIHERQRKLQQLRQHWIHSTQPTSHFSHAI